MVVSALFATGFVPLVVVFALDRNEDTKYIADLITGPLRIFPAFNLGDGFVKLTESFFFAEFRGVDQNLFGNEMAGAAIRAMVFAIPLHLVLLVLLEGSFLPFFMSCLSEWFSVLPAVQETVPGPTSSAEMKSRAGVEYRRVSLQAENLWKAYSTVTSCPGYLMSGVFWVFRCFFFALVGRDFPIGRNATSQCRHAVRNLSLTLHEDEVLSVVGSNGCGKSTLLGMLTGEINPTFGSVYVHEKNLYSMIPCRGLDTRASIGLCPQVRCC